MPGKPKKGKKPGNLSSLGSPAQALNQSQSFPSYTSPFIVSRSRRSVAGPRAPGAADPECPHPAAGGSQPRSPGERDEERAGGTRGRGAPGKDRGRWRRGGGRRRERGSAPGGCGGRPAGLDQHLARRSPDNGGSPPPAETQLCLRLLRTTLQKQNPNWTPSAAPGGGGRLPPRIQTPVQGTRPCRRHPGRSPLAFLPSPVT